MDFNPLNLSATNITSEELQKLPLYSYSGQAEVITHAKELEAALDEMRQHAVLGFDTETKPTFVKGQVHKVALVQIAAPEKVWLIRLQKTGFTQELLSFFQDSQIKKAGIGLRQDLAGLQQLKRFQATGFVEITDITEKSGIEVESVRKLAGLLLGVRISKNAQLSNWEALTLTPKQIEYAATDAWICLQMYKKLEAI